MMKQAYAMPTVARIELKAEQAMVACKTFGQAVLGAPGAPQNIYTCTSVLAQPACKDFTVS